MAEEKDKKEKVTEVKPENKTIALNELINKATTAAEQFEAANKAAERLEAANLKNQEILKRMEEVAAQTKLGGDTEAGKGEEEKKPLSAAEYAKLALEGKIGKG